MNDNDLTKLEAALQTGCYCSFVSLFVSYSYYLSKSEKLLLKVQCTAVSSWHKVTLEDNDKYFWKLTKFDVPRKRICLFCYRKTKYSIFNGSHPYLWKLTMSWTPPKVPIVGVKSFVLSISLVFYVWFNASTPVGYFPCRVVTNDNDNKRTTIK